VEVGLAAAAATYGVGRMLGGRLGLILLNPLGLQTCDHLRVSGGICTTFPDDAVRPR
jgi:hypothetical protein